MATLSLDIETAIADAVDASIRETFSMMIGHELEHVATRHIAQAIPTVRSNGTSCPVDFKEEITVIVGLSGGLQGSVSVCLDRESAILWTVKLIDHETEMLDQTVIDAIGELGNMVVGGAKGRLEDFSLTIGLPCVLLAGASRLAFPSSCIPTQLQYSVNGHELSVFVSLIKSNL